MQVTMCNFPFLADTEFLSRCPLLVIMGHAVSTMLLFPFYVLNHIFISYIFIILFTRF